METTLLLNTSMFLTLTILLTPILLPLLSKKFQNTPSIIKHNIKTAFLTSLIPMTIFMY